MRPWRRWGLLAAGCALLASTLIAPATATAANPAPAPPTSAFQPATVAIQPSIRDLLASHSGPVDTTQCEALFSVACYEPQQIQTAYDEGPLFKRGVTGRNQTIAIIDAFGSPTIATDLAMFDKSFGLPAPPSLRMIQPAGPVPPFDPHNSSMIAWASETTLDVEWVHVMAPGAGILLVETPVAETEGTTGFPQIVQAENYVIDHHLAGIISQSFSATEETLPQGQRSLIPLRSSFINAFNRGVTVLASSGDYGSTDPLNSAGTVLSNTPVTTWPASDPLVTGVGGTQLHLSATTGARTAPDSVWNDGNNTKLDQEFFGNSGPDAAASGGGLSVDFSRPRYQARVAGVVGRTRGVPDVSMSAACNGAVDVYESFPGVGQGWYLSCGTSESTPLFAGIVALADQMAHRPLGLINPAMYKLSARQAPGISDVTTGNNTVSFHSGKTLVTVPGQAARPGYDLASGVGTVDAARFVPELVEATNHDHDHGPPPCPSDGHHDEVAGYGNGHGDGHCCSDTHDQGRCCPDGYGAGDGHDCDANSCRKDGRSVTGGSGQPAGSGATLSPGATGATGSTRPAGPITSGSVAAGAPAAAAPTTTSSPSTSTTAAPSSPEPTAGTSGSAGTAGTGSATPGATQPSTSTSTSSSTASPAIGGSPGPAGYVTLVVPAGVGLGPAATVRELLKE
jgi:hypothetical protein